MKCSQILYPPDLTQALQPVDRHVGIQYKAAVYQAVRDKSMQLIQKCDGGSPSRMKPMEKRILITKVVAETHERLALAGAFKRSFLATGT